MRRALLRTLGALEEEAVGGVQPGRLPLDDTFPEPARHRLPAGRARARSGSSPVSRMSREDAPIRIRWPPPSVVQPAAVQCWKLRSSSVTVTRVDSPGTRLTLLKARRFFGGSPAAAGCVTYTWATFGARPAAGVGDVERHRDVAEPVGRADAEIGVSERRVGQSEGVTASGPSSGHPSARWRCLPRRADLWLWVAADRRALPGWCSGVLDRFQRGTGPSQ